MIIDWKSLTCALLLLALRLRSFAQLSEDHFCMLYIGFEALV